MHRYEESIVTLADSRSKLHWEKVSLLVSSSPSFHVYNHLLKRIWLFLNLATTDWRQKKVRVFIDIWLGCINLATGFACKVFLCFSVFYGLGPHHSAMYHHILVHVTIPHISNRTECYLLQRWHISQSYIYAFLDIHELFNTFVLLVCYQFWLHGNKALLEKFEEFFRKVVEFCTFRGEIVQKF